MHDPHNAMTRSSGLSGPSFEAISFLLPIIDIAIILGASIGGATAAYEFGLTDVSNTSSLYGLGMIASALYVFKMRETNHYDVRFVRIRNLELGLILQTWIATAIILFTLIFLFKLQYVTPRSSILVFFSTAVLGLIGWRVLAKFVLRRAIERSAIGKRRVLLIGENAELNAADYDGLLAFYGVAEVEQFAFSRDDDLPFNEADEQTLCRAVALAKDIDATEILIAISWSHTQRLERLREALRATPAPVSLLPDSRIRALTSFPSFSIRPSLQVELQRAPLSPLDRSLKRCIDVVLSLIAIIVLSPLIAIVAVLIKLDSKGPVLFTQPRSGFNSRIFTIYKFRSMIVHDENGPLNQATKNDARVTRFGRFLRASSIDELPQLINVLLGDMSLVGPRPHAVSHDFEFERMLAEYAFRRHVKPGITGWAQCKGRRGPTPSVSDIRARVDLDLWYIGNWSLFLDFKILVRSVFVVFGHKNAF